MKNNLLNKLSLSGFQIKIIALISMTIDHFGFIFYPDDIVLRSVGRISFPLFAFMIAEGCKYTRNKLKYFLQMFILGVLCQIVVTIFDEPPTLNILLTFAFSALTIFIYQYISDSDNPFYFAVFGLYLLALFYVSEMLPQYASGFIPFDYDFIGIMTPLAVYIARDRIKQYMAIALCIVIWCSYHEPHHMFAFLSLPILMLYNGQRGKYSLKYFFYLYYPLHLGVLWIIFESL